MGKKLWVRLSYGFSITTAVCLIVQLVVAELAGSAVTPAFAARFRSGDAAALAQLGLTGLVGAAFAGAAALFEMERWSYLKQGALHFLVTAAVWMPVVWLCWMPQSRAGMWYTVGGWSLTYGINWTVQYFLYRRKVRELNRSIRAFRAREGEHEGD